MHEIIIYMETNTNDLEDKNKKFWIEREARRESSAYYI